jgi:hypothetical protein
VVNQQVVHVAAVPLVLVWIAIAGCSSAPPSTAAPAAPPPVSADAAVDAAVPDALPEAVTSAPAWIFRYHTAQRSETWTLRHAEGVALLIVESGQGTTRYVGTAIDGATLALDVSTRTAKMTLDCKRAKRPLGTKCNDTRAKPVEVLDCYHPDFEAPMPFGRAPGVEYVVDDRCTGYRLIGP